MFTRFAQMRNDFRGAVFGRIVGNVLVAGHGVMPDVEQSRTGWLSLSSSSYGPPTPAGTVSQHRLRSINFLTKEGKRPDSIAPFTKSV